MCIQISFLWTFLWTITACKWFFARVYSVMSDKILVTCKLFFTSRAIIISWAKFVRLQNKYYKFDKNLLKTQSRFNIFFMQFKNMFFQTSFLICCIWTVLANEGFFASMDSDMSDNISITWKWFVANRTSKRFWAKFVTLQNKNSSKFIKLCKRFKNCHHDIFQYVFSNFLFELQHNCKTCNDMVFRLYGFWCVW